VIKHSTIKFFENWFWGAEDGKTNPKDKDLMTGANKKRCLTLVDFGTIFFPRNRKDNTINHIEN
jgi:hypothetical protein